MLKVPKRRVLLQFRFKIKTLLQRALLQYHSFVCQFCHPSKMATYCHANETRCKPCGTEGRAERCCCLCWGRSSKPCTGSDPQGCSSWAALELGTQQVGKSSAPALLLLLQSLGAGGFSCLSVTYRDAGQSSFPWRLPGEALLPAPHARKAMAVLPKASPSPASGDKREPYSFCFRCKWKEIV